MVNNNFGFSKTLFYAVVNIVYFYFLGRNPKQGQTVVVHYTGSSLAIFATSKAMDCFSSHADVLKIFPNIFVFCVFIFLL